MAAALVAVVVGVLLCAAAAHGITTATGSALQAEPCNGTIVNCLVSPCSVNKGKCPAGTTCVDSYCDGCKFK